jgi:hypothetical protein
VDLSAYAGTTVDLEFRFTTGTNTTYRNDCALDDIVLDCTTSGITYSWSPSTDLSNASIQNPDFTMPTSPDTVILECTVTGGICPVTDTVRMVNCLTVLSVNWLTLEGERIGQSAKLSWTSSSDFHADHFRLERKDASSEHFSGLQTIRAVPANQQNGLYTDLDLSPEDGKNQYRIIQVDKDGEEHTSNRVELYFGTSNDFSLSVYPNPTHDNVNIEMNSAVERPVTLEVFDAVGKRVHQLRHDLSTGDETLTMDASEFAKGAYLIRATSGGERLGNVTFLKR